MKKSLLVVVALVLLLAFAAVGCSGGQSAESAPADSAAAPADSAAAPAASESAPAAAGGEAKVAGPEFVVAWIHGNSGYQSAAVTLEAAQAYIKEHDIQWTIEETDCKNDASLLTKAIEDAVTKKVNVILTDFANMDAAANAIVNANNANIPIFTLDTGRYIPGTVCEVTTNNAENAAKEAMYFINLLGGEANVVVFDMEAHAGVRMRTAIFNSVAGQFSGIKVLENYNIDPERYMEDATNTMEGFISKYGMDGIDGVWCSFDECAMGVSNAIISAGGSRDNIVVTGYDGHRDVALDKMKDPKYPQVSTVAQNFGAYAGIAFDLIQRIVVNGEDPAMVLNGRDTVYVRAALITVTNNIDKMPETGSAATTPDAFYGDYTNVTDYKFSWQ